MSLSRPTLILVALTFFSGSSLAQQTYTTASLERLASARTVGISSEVNYPRADKAKYGDDTEVNRILSYTNGTQLYARYMVVAPDKADIIITLTENVISETVSIVVRDADTNEQLFSETRDLVVLSNDVKRLVAHFLATVPPPPPPHQMELPKFVPMSTTLRPGGMRIRFDKGVKHDTRAELLKVLEEAVTAEALKDPNFSIQFSSEDGLFITYEVHYKGKVTNSSKTALSPVQFEREIEENW
jgi:hypothetical protein